MTEKAIRIMALTETWLRDGDSPTIVDLCPTGYRYLGENRPQEKASRGGGVGIVLAPDVAAERLPTAQHETFESLSIKVNQEGPLIVILIYRPPSSREGGHNAPAFVSEFEEYVTTVISQNHCGIMILGDFNLHWEKNDHTTKPFKDVIEYLNMKQHVLEPTHKHQHTLDLVITCDKMTKRIHNIAIEDPKLSDHYLVLFAMDSIANTNKHPSTRRRLCRPMKRLNVEDLSRDLASLPSTSNAATYNQHVIEVLDRHAPKKTVVLKGHSAKPWYDDEIHSERRRRRQLERRYRKTKLAIDEEILDIQSKKVIRIIQEKKATYYNQKFVGATMKETYQLLSSLLEVQSDQQLPRSSNDTTMANAFARFFHEKVQAIQSSMTATSPASPMDAPAPTRRLTEFSIPNEAAIAKVISSSASKSCELDPLPTWLLKRPQILACLLPAITKIIQKSLQSGEVPQSFKEAEVRPKLKKEGLDPNNLNNFRPISNLPFLSKVLERVVCDQITKHLEVNDLFDPLQSAYRKSHSTETAILKIKADADRMLDEANGVCLVLLDLSAAFDTLDHGIMEKRLESAGLSGIVLTWIKSYLANRFQRVRMNDALSEKIPLTTGVPQGSVLGPLLFLLYVRPLGSIISRHKVHRHGFADDTQLYCKLSLTSPEEQKGDIMRMESCLQDVRKWMTENKLKLNEQKTETLIITREVDKAKAEGIKIRVGDAEINPSKWVRNLGSFLDDDLSMRKQVSTTMRNGYLQLRRISHIRKYINQDTCAKIINSTVTSRLDFQNGLLLGAKAGVIRPLQVLQNNAARLLTRTRRREHITPILRQLHWLPVKARIEFKTLVTIHLSLHQPSSPLYLRNLFAMYEPRRPLRTNPWTLAIPQTRRQEGARSIATQGASLWNRLPEALRCPMPPERFKKHLKTHLFNNVYQ